jgi:hypothetical protein
MISRMIPDSNPMINVNLGCIYQRPIMKYPLPSSRGLSALSSAAAKTTTALLAIGQLLFGLPLHADPLDTREVVYPVTTSYQGGNVFYGDGQWIELRPEICNWGPCASRTDGRIRHSADGINWSKSQVPPGIAPISAAYANGLWVVVAEEGLDGVDQFSVVLTSNDGVVWEKRNAYSETWRLLNVNPYLEHVAYGNGLWVAMGWKGQYLTSTDGLHWTPGAISNYHRIQHLSYGNGQWLALARYWGELDRAYVSTTGLSWTKHELPMEGLRSIAFGGDQWAAIVYGEEENQMVTSTDGVEWVTRLSIAHPWGAEAQRWQIGYGDGRWLIAGTELKTGAETGPWNSFTYSSTDGLSWERKTIPTSPLFEQFASYASVSYGNGRWLLKAKRYYSFDDPYLLTSTDTENWTAAVEPSTSFSSLTYGDGQWVAAGTGLNGAGIYTSVNSREWTRVSTTSVSALAYGNGRWTGSGAGGIVTSTDLSNWTLAFAFKGSIRSFAFANGLWVAAGTETLNNGNQVPLLVTSSNGLAWTKRTVPSGATYLNKPFFGGGRWIVLGSRGTGSESELSMLTSTDGVSWSYVSGLTSYLPGADLHFAEGLWIALAGRLHPDGIRRPTTLQSTDGLQWTIRDVDLELNQYSELSSITHAAGRWLLGSHVPIGSRFYHALLSSADGQQWKTHLGPVYSAASNGKELLSLEGRYIISFGRLIPAAPPLLRLSREGPALSLWLSGEVGEQYAIE